jgi:hypothetical protein
MAQRCTRSDPTKRPDVTGLIRYVQIRKEQEIKACKERVHK